VSGYTAGIDVGSATTKVVLFDGHGPAGHRVVDTPADGSEPSPRLLTELLAEAGLAEDALSACCATGYGRARVAGAQSVVSEITAAARGAACLAGDTPPRGIIDVGGEDTKVIRLDSAGYVEDFVMNDRCAAGTGRFLEVAAGRFGLSVSELAELAASAEGETELSSVCTVFAASEAAAHLAEGEEPARLAAGLHRSAARRIAALGHTLAIEPPVLVIGGGALNPFLLKMLGDELHLAAQSTPLAQVACALGAAMVAMERAQRQG